MMANYELVEFIAIMERLNDECTIFSLKASDRRFYQTIKEIRRKSELPFLFFFAISKLKGFEF